MARGLIGDPAQLVGDLVTSYALHDAKLDLAQATLDHPGTRDGRAPNTPTSRWPSATTLATTDITGTMPQMRRAVTVDAVVSFADNSVIVALLVSILTR